MYDCKIRGRSCTQGRCLQPGDDGSLVARNLNAALREMQQKPEEARVK